MGWVDEVEEVLRGTGGERVGRVMLGEGVRGGEGRRSVYRRLLTDTTVTRVDAED